MGAKILVEGFEAATSLSLGADPLSYKGIATAIIINSILATDLISEKSNSDYSKKLEVQGEKVFREETNIVEQNFA